MKVTFCTTFVYGIHKETGEVTKPNIDIGVSEVDENYNWYELDSQEALDAIPSSVSLQPGYSVKRFLTSLLADETLRVFASDKYYAAISDCLKFANFEGLHAIMQMSIADESSIGSPELATYFLTKLQTEEGVSL